MLTVQGATFAVDALLDTGFEGYVIVPAAFFGAGILADTLTEWGLVDGPSIRTPAYLGDIDVGGLANITALISEVGAEVLVGRRLTDQFTATLDHGQRLIIEP